MSNILIEAVTEGDPTQLPTELGFGVHFTDRMFSQRYSTMRSVSPHTMCCSTRYAGNRADCP